MQARTFSFVLDSYVKFKSIFMWNSIKCLYINYIFVLQKKYLVIHLRCFKFSQQNACVFYELKGLTRVDFFYSFIKSSLCGMDLRLLKDITVLFMSSMLHV